ncbi:MAG: hypothetical protein MRY57_00480 [Candidatus Pacebacteria bacterium]|nr:hypothetical protein [Candidatus Paceibacterota bacterium]
MNKPLTEELIIVPFLSFDELGEKIFENNDNSCLDKHTLAGIYNAIESLHELGSQAELQIKINTRGTQTIKLPAKILSKNVELLIMKDDTKDDYYLVTKEIGSTIKSCPIPKKEIDMVYLPLFSYIHIQKGLNVNLY